MTGNRCRLDEFYSLDASLRFLEAGEQQRLYADWAAARGMEARLEFAQQEPSRLNRVLLPLAGAGFLAAFWLDAPGPWMPVFNGVAVCCLFLRRKVPRIVG